MANYSVNNCREIVYYDAQGTRQSITKVMYCDNNGVLRTVWPCKIRLSNVYLVKFGNNQSADVAYPYTVDTNTNIPSVTIMPESPYGFKGDIEVYREPGVLEKTIYDCYFRPETVSVTLDPSAHYSFSPVPSNEAYTFGDRVATASTNETYVVEYNRYSAWRADTYVGATQRMELQLGWWEPSIGYAQNGFIFDTNYVTRLILKRADIIQSIVLANTSSNNITQNNQLFGSFYTLTDLSDSITVYPKYNKYASDSNTGERWEEYSSINTPLTLTYDNTKYSVVDNNDGSWTIQALSYGSDNPAITFSDGTYNCSLGLACVPNTSYNLWAQGNPISTTASTPIVLTQPFTFSIMNINTGNEYTGSNYSFSVTDGDSSAVTISGKTIRPSRDPNKLGHTATISGTVEGVGVNNAIHVEVGNIVTYYKAGPLITSGTSATINGSINTLNSTNSVTWSSPSSGDNFGIELYEDSSGNTTIPMYCDPLSTSPFYTSGVGADNRLIIAYSGSGSGSVTVPIYTDSTKTAQLCSITITVS